MKTKDLLKRYLHPRVIETLRRANAHARDLSFLMQRFAATAGLPIRPTDEMWFELQFRPQEALKLYRIPLPSFPPDEVQTRFTGMTGRENLKQAFHFYKYVYSACRLRQIKDATILDFGGGWGRISRFFLRDTKPERIYIADCLSDSIHWLHETGNPCNIIENDPLPPIRGLAPIFDVIYSFSVFTHLSPHALDAWLPYLLQLLRPGGHLAITVYGILFIENLTRLHREQPAHYLVEKLPPPGEILARYEKGELQWYPIGGGGELTSEFYGETILPRHYLEENYGSLLVDFIEGIPHIGQDVAIFRAKEN